MKLGLLVRADNRGLGIQSFETWRHLSPEISVAVEMGPHTPYEQHFDRYPGSLQARFRDGKFVDYAPVLDALSDADVVLTQETFYDDRLVEDLRARGVRTAVQGNWEFLRWISEPALARPDLFLAPSTWHLDRWPAGTVYLPTPVATDVLPYRHRDRAETFVHVGGHRAMQDRNGTRLVLLAGRFIRSAARVVVRSQSLIGRSIVGRDRVEVEIHDAPHYADNYRDADVLVAPRRFGGQSLPMNEALALGMPVITLDVDPQRRYLPAESLIPTRRRRSLKVQSGQVDWFDAQPSDLAKRIDEFFEKPALVSALSEKAGEWAAAHSWDALLPRWRSVLEGLAAS